MVTLYVACLVSGAVLLAISLFSGGDAEMDSELDVNGDIGDSLEVEADVAGNIEAHTEATSGIQADTVAETGTHTSVATGGSSALAAAFQFFSFRNIVYLITFFGLTGSILTWLNIASAVTFISALGMGGFAMTIGHKFMRYLKESESGQIMHVRDLIGHVAVVTIPLAKERKGKIRIVVGGRVHSLTAVVHENSDKNTFGYGENVLILDFSNSTAKVDEADFAEASTGELPRT